MLALLLVLLVFLVFASLLSFAPGLPLLPAAFLLITLVPLVSETIILDIILCFVGRGFLIGITRHFDPFLLAVCARR